MRQSTIANWEQRNNLDTVSENPSPGPNISDENTFRWKNVKSILDDRFRSSETPMHAIPVTSFTRMSVRRVYSIHMLLQLVII